MQKIKKLLIYILLILFVFSLLLLCFGRGIPSFIPKPDKIFGDKYYLKMDRNLFYRQTMNNCGPYSVMAVINILQQENKEPEILAKEMKWRIYKNLTFPQGVVNQLHENGIKIKEYVLKHKSDEDKIDWLKETVFQGKPVICLIKIHHVLHYVTVLGYDENGFMLYDSMQEKNPENQRKTIIDNNCLEGNRYYSYKEFIQLWNEGGYKIFFRNWAIVCG
ncbi:MAG: C39 family peptidase [Treponema sp.]|nr:C39 family peptidase [Treponema sp.]